MNFVTFLPAARLNARSSDSNADFRHFAKHWTLYSTLENLTMKSILLIFCIVISISNFSQSDYRRSDYSELQKIFDRDTAFIRKYPDSARSVKLLNFHFSSLPYTIGAGLFKEFSSDFATLPEYVQLEEKVRNGLLTQPGTALPAFSYLNTKGRMEELGTIVKSHRYTLLDFWASWCLPCRKNMGHLKTLFQKFNSKGFGIVSISIDKDKSEWLKAINQDGIDLFYHGIDDAQKSIQLKLGIITIPTYLLLDEQMKIVGRFNSRWNGQLALQEFLEQNLK